MIAFKPEFGYVLEIDIFCDLLRIDVAMVIHDGKFFCKLVIKLSSRVGLKKKVIVDQAVHKAPHLF